MKNAATSINYALFGTPLEAMYGEHLKRFLEIKRKYGPENVMGLGGGWKTKMSDSRVLFHVGVKRKTVRDN